MPGIPGANRCRISHVQGYRNWDESILRGHFWEAIRAKGCCSKARNWKTKPDELATAGADQRLTEFLIHIRKAYRNPITHPDVIIESAEAFNFFSRAISVISMMLGAEQAKAAKD
jgi:hypothetical protein